MRETKPLSIFKFNFAIVKKQIIKLDKPII